MQDIYDYMLQTKDERQSHLDLTQLCEERGTNSTECRALLAVALETSIPRGRNIHCCHACHNGKCSNWRHLYWGTNRENVEDAISDGKQFRFVPRAGEDSHNYNIAPWRAASAKRDFWAMASDILEEYERHGWSFEDRGRGYRFIERRYGMSQRVAINLTNKLRSGWLPTSDPEWLEDFEINTYGI